ncbi:hypothetical protein FEM03_00645 [Phragmitibacter flavus]|uniref:Wax synthase domain-containing protein n=1 Tax=Phragmitibacter flavus TaxID=2576071 RepID=A0A5R8KJW8_9BACT|nr:membrane bound O-acyl transferase family-domain-containing protein [Phragmitibacter flavus]TLD72618.1 hypothetical protein FEM03_00645 [Phragmitibacter flavus]
MNALHTTLPAWVSMWIVAGLLFAVGKTISAWWLWKITHRPLQVAAFAFGWVGMNPQEWNAPAQRRPLVRQTGAGVIALLLGVLLLWGIARLLPHPLAAGWCGMVGLVLILHFGLFRLLADFWQTQGHAVQPLMNRPAAAMTLAEFWGKRWNRAFRDLAHPLVLLPVHRRFGAVPALLACFAVSGIVHELVISIPAGAGYGLPFGYFMLQAVGQLIERRFRLRSWFFTHAFTLLPVGLLFHPPFVSRVMLPFFKTIGALP